MADQSHWARRNLAPAADTPACPHCGNAGWVLDCKIDKHPTTLELIPCIFPLCGWSGREVAVLCTYALLNTVTTAPDGRVLSLTP